MVLRTIAPYIPTPKDGGFTAQFGKFPQPMNSKRPRGHIYTFP